MRGIGKAALRIGKRYLRRKRPLRRTPAIEGRRLVFIGGLHRSGTSLVHALLREHPEVSGFTDTGVYEDEGQHLQTVFAPAFRHGGPGAFAFDPRSRLTEASPLVTPENRDRLLREWGAYYNLERARLLEKSPPNLVRSRFLQALFPGAAFVFVVRHPVAVALATRKWTRASVTELLLHWHVAHAIMLHDRGNLGRCLVFRYEDLVRSPQVCLDAICDFAGIAKFVPRQTIADHNAKYLREWTDAHAEQRELMERVCPTGFESMQAFGYRWSQPLVGADAQGTAEAQGTLEAPGTAEAQGTLEAQGTAKARGNPAARGTVEAQLTV
jgi:hypothetical protein